MESDMLFTMFVGMFIVVAMMMTVKHMIVEWLNNHSSRTVKKISAYCERHPRLFGRRHDEFYCFFRKKTFVK
ncbi:hypothetical protein [Pseudodesulfovibrio tunisiensis]|uniref:hypothetical protein n=1 Tax=Pseudodesulfovibrio tunisiensis TaxID=463192 RepID=UPI001FB1E100|nr:hypothetical protein [Pseudodesulfovibrio tunisiensis]